MKFKNYKKESETQNRNNNNSFSIKKNVINQTINFS